MIKILLCFETLYDFIRTWGQQELTTAEANLPIVTSTFYVFEKNPSRN